MVPDPVTTCDPNYIFQLVNVKNEGDKANNRLKTIVNSNLIAIFAEVLQNQMCNDIENRI